MHTCLEYILFIIIIIIIITIIIIIIIISIHLFASYLHDISTCDMMYAKGWISKLNNGRYIENAIS